MMSGSRTRPQRSFFATVTLVALATLLLPTSPASAEDLAWGQFRGHNGSGVSPNATPPREFGPQKNLAWKATVPSGLSSPVIVGDQILLTIFEDGKLGTLSLSTKDGAQLWKQFTPDGPIEEYHKTLGSPAASSVVSDGNTVVSYFGSRGLFAYSLDGKPLWSVSLPMAKTHANFGSGTSPIIVDGKVILVRDLVDNSSLTAYDLKTGEKAWQTDRKGVLTSYSTPVFWKNSQREEIVVAGSYQMKSYDPTTGRELWSVSQLPAVAVASPVVSGDLLLYAGWAPPADGEDAMPDFDQLLGFMDKDKNGTIERAEADGTEMAPFFDNQDNDHNGHIERTEWEHLKEMLRNGVNRVFAVRAGGSGDITKSHVVWSQDKGVTLPYVPCPVVSDDQLFVIKDGGQVSLLEANTGKAIVARKRVAEASPYFASPVIADGHIYLCSTSGVVTVLKFSPELTEVSSLALDEGISATPAVTGNRLYVRTAGTLYAFEAK